MDSLHSVMRSLRPAPTKRKRDHLTVFREFLSHLDRVSKQNAARDVKAVRRPKGTEGEGLVRSRLPGAAQRGNGALQTRDPGSHRSSQRSRFCDSTHFDARIAPGTRAHRLPRER